MIVYSHHPKLSIDTSELEAWARRPKPQTRRLRLLAGTVKPQDVVLLLDPYTGISVAVEKHCLRPVIETAMGEWCYDLLSPCWPRESLKYFKAIPLRDGVFHENEAFPASDLVK